MYYFVFLVPSWLCSQLECYLIKYAIVSVQFCRCHQLIIWCFDLLNHSALILAFLLSSRRCYHNLFWVGGLWFCQSLLSFCSLTWYEWYRELFYMSWFQFSKKRFSKYYFLQTAELYVVLSNNWQLPLVTNNCHL